MLSSPFRKSLLNYRSVKVQSFSALSTDPLNKSECPAHDTRKTTTACAIDDADEFKNARPASEIPGPKQLPFLGIMHHFFPGGKFYKVKMTDLHWKIREEYGDLIRLPGGMGRPDLVLTFNPDHFAKLYRNEGQYPHRRSFAVFEYFRKHERPDLFKGKAGLLSDQGEAWYETRTRVNPVMLQPKTAKKYIEPVEQISDEFIQRIRAIRDGNDETPADFSNEMNKWALESIACIGLETRLGLLGEIEKDSDGQRMIQSVHDFFNYSYELEIMPSIWRYYKTPTFKKLIASLHVMTDCTSNFVDKALEKLQNKSEDDTGEMSVLEKLLKIDRNLAIMMVLDMLMAGVDTTSMSSIGVMYHLAKNPEKQAILREEILSKLPEKSSNLCSQTMANMPYLRACIKEAARLNPVTLGNIRTLPHDIVLSGFRIPKGFEVSTGNNVAMNDDKYYKDSAKFLPERFLKKDENMDIKGKHPYVYLPFGFGPRMCVGRRFAELEMEVFISKIIRNFEINWNHADMEWTSKMLNMPSGDIRFQFKDLK